MQPNNAAFNDLPEGLVDRLSDPGWILHLQNLIDYHVFIGSFLSDEMMNGAKWDMLNGDELTINVDIDTGAVMLSTPWNQTAMVITPNLEASNGVLHEIDEVLLPSWYYRDPLDAPPEFSTLVMLLEAAMLPIPADEAFTIFAPTNEAFEALEPGALDALLNDPSLPLLLA